MKDQMDKKYREYTKPEMEMVELGIDVITTSDPRNLDWKEEAGIDDENTGAGGFGL